MSKRYPLAKWTLPITIDPPRTCYTIPVPDDPYHRAAFRGALLALASATKWQDDLDHTAKAAAAVWREIYDLVVACEETTETLPESWDEDLTALCEALRFQNGKLQALCCGEWVDIDGQPAQGWLAAGTGAGTTPPVSGGCEDYKATIDGNGYWYAPFIVNTGDTIHVTNALGATYNPAATIWQCPDGSLFFAGACLSSTVTAAGNPMPAILSGKLIAKIGSTFYDVYNGTFTVPGGVVNQPVQFQFNYASLVGSSGTVTFDVEYCNNAVGAFTHTFDFTLNDGGFTVVAVGGGGSGSNGVWTPGVGWQNALSHYSTNSYRLVELLKSGAPARTLTGISATLAITLGTITGAAITDSMQTVVGASGTVRASTPYTSPPTSPWGAVFSAPAADGLFINLCSGSVATAGGDPGGTITLSKLVVTGLGTDPY